jgi:Asp-tRNA(Asn)/Glu-tRNA(Gln) amidotransferase A subunit family amidase
MNPCNQSAPMARSVADCALMFNVISGPHPVDPATVKPKLTLATEFESIKGLRVALSHDLGYFRVADDVRRNTLRVVDALRDAGAIVDEVTLPWDRSIIDAYTNHLGFLLGGPLALAIREHRDKVSDYVVSFADMAARITPEMFFSAGQTNAHMHASLQEVLGRYDVLICPTLADTNSPAEGMANAHDDLMNRGLTYPFNLLGRHPVLAVPSGIADNGVPTGVQIVGRTFDEPMVMRIGAAVERQLPWRYPDL